MTEIFPTNIDRNFLNHTGKVRPFCGFPMLACYQNHRLLSSTRFDNSFMHSWCHAKRLCMVVIPCFELPFSFRSSIVNKAVVGCCRYSFVYYTLSETLTIHWAIWFWPATTFAVIVVICFTQTLELFYLMMFPTLAMQQ